METTKENNSVPPLGANVPEWVMHLLTGMGTMGAEYMLFIKPIQEKMELQRQLLEQQNQRIKRLENALKIKGIKLSARFEESDDDDEEDSDLFHVKRKPTNVPKYRKYSQIKL